MEQQIRRRKPAIERKISEIREDDTRISIIGKVIKVDKMEYMFWVDDKTGVAMVEAESDLPRVGQVVRVIGRIIRNEEGMHIYAEVIQDFSDADLEALEEIMELERKILPQLDREVMMWWSE
ncbi:hypothetical protein [Pyrococcus sp. ST04]|uniref:hypothetical protein n=1 Tax=Pyrococcus sp. ST04 TaxID=1183377 RepID=UPI00026058AD|nr:hypothetical protein [Pyrococcus sp. ST04]AFK21634.1 hypothetical protein Py04_0028 [Pyrococcus sp. ST04]